MYRRVTTFLLMAAVVVGCVLGTGVASAAPKVSVTDGTKTPLNNGTLGKVQKAIDAAAACQQTVFLPAGTYLCSTLKLRRQMGLYGHPAFTYRANGGQWIQGMLPPTPATR